MRDLPPLHKLSLGAPGGSGDGEDESSYEIEAADVISWGMDVPGDNTRAHLTISSSLIIPSEPGLFAAEDIGPNKLVSVYTYDRVLNDEELRAIDKDTLKEMHRYAVAGPIVSGQRVGTYILNVPVNAAAHPASQVNEPRENEDANVSFVQDLVTLSNGHVYHIMLLYTCTYPVKKGTELTMNYGMDYEINRKAQKIPYEAGSACTSAKQLDPTPAEVAKRIFLKRGPCDLDGILYDVTEPDEGDSSEDKDPSWGQKGVPGKYGEHRTHQTRAKRRGSPG